MTAQARRYRIHGIVQGVGYRWYAVQRAGERRVSGFVRNLPDGSVEVVAEGESEQLEALRRDLEIGPSHASVRGVEEVPLAATGRYIGFTVLR